MCLPVTVELLKSDERLPFTRSRVLLHGRRRTSAVVDVHFAIDAGHSRVCWSNSVSLFYGDTSVTRHDRLYFGNLATPLLVF